MKLKATSLFLGLCLAIMAVAANPAHARVVTGFGGFHVEVQGTVSTNSYLCLEENYGAVVNDCSTDVSLAFDLPVDNAGEKTIYVQDYWTGSGFPFTCQLYSYGDSGNLSYNYGGSITLSEPHQQTQNSFSVNVPNGWSLQVICFNVPPGGGIANLNYNQ
jgi:hypothetical protein